MYHHNVQWTWRRPRLAAAALLGVVALCAQQGDVPDLKTLVETGGGLPEIVNRFSEDRGSLNRFHDLELSPQRRSRMRRFYTQWQGTLAKLEFPALDIEGQIDYLLLDNLLDHQLRQLDLEEKRASEMALLIPFADEVVRLHERRRQREPVNPQEAASLLAKLDESVAELRKEAERAALIEEDFGPGGAGASEEPGTAAEMAAMPEAVVNRAARAVAGLRETLKAWYEFHSRYDPFFTWWVEEPYQRLYKSLEDYHKSLRERVLGLDPDDQDTVVGDPIGREALLVELAAEMIPYTPEELIEIGEKEMAWCEREMLKAAGELGYGDDWLQALEHVKQLHVEPGKQPDLIRRLALEAVEFIEKRELVTVPPLAIETWRVRMMSPERQKVNPFFTGGEVISVSYPTDTMTHEQKLMSMRGNNIHFSRATVHHELIPGHHLQQFMRARYRPYRRVFRTPFWTEGWALWWELFLWDLDFPQSPENRIGMLFWRMHRCARIIFSLGFHLGRMSADECVDFLVNRVGHERENAAAEVRRSFTGDYSPLYQCAYLLGGLQFRALHRELVGGGRMRNREFHDAILRRNAIPVEMIRASLTGGELSPGFTPNWRFYEQE